MKKLLSVLVLLLVATALFAGFKLEAGGVFEFADIVIFKAENSWFKNEIAFRTQGFGFELSASYYDDYYLMGYAQASMVFPQECLVMEKAVDHDWSKLSGATNLSIRLYNFSAGVGYYRDLTTFKLAGGGGLSFNSTVIKYDTSEYTPTVATQRTYVYNIGLSAFLDFKYVLNKKIEFGLRANPQLGLYNIASVFFTDADGKDVTAQALEHQGVTGAKANGFRTSFTVPVTVGITYSY